MHIIELFINVCKSSDKFDVRGHGFELGNGGTFNIYRMRRFDVYWGRAGGTDMDRKFNAKSVEDLLSYLRKKLWNMTLHFEVPSVK